MNTRTLVTPLLGAALLLAGCGDADREAPAAEPALAPPPAAAPAAPAAPATGTLLDPDAATRDELLAVPGMNAAAADALLAGRPYADMRAADRVLAAHLDEAGREAVYARVWKPLDLNTATPEEILLIPGVGARMRHEFEEYRPYRGMEQFRREIGKYVDDGEVARLERYVAVK